MAPPPCSLPPDPSSCPSDLTPSAPQTRPPDELALEFSIACFVSDMLHLLVFRPSDVLFIFLTCSCLVHHGAYELLLLLIIEEITGGGAGTTGLSMAIVIKVYEQPISAPVYTIVRGILGPIFVYKMGQLYLKGGCQDVMSKWVWMSWLVVIVSSIYASILWVSMNWIETQLSHT